MASLTITVDDTIVPRVIAAYNVANAGQLKTAIINEIRNKVAHYESSLKLAEENNKLILAEGAKQVAVQKAKTDAESQVILT